LAGFSYLWPGRFLVCLRFAYDPHRHGQLRQVQKWSNVGQHQQRRRNPAQTEPYNTMTAEAEGRLAGGVIVSAHEAFNDALNALARPVAAVRHVS
jgi:hypothetical protein